jgi:hypothetical protein
MKWNYEQERSYKGDVVKGERQMYLHIYYNPERVVEDEQRFTRKLLQLQRELQSRERKLENARLYDKYFEVQETPVRGVQ